MILMHLVCNVITIAALTTFDRFSCHQLIFLELNLVSKKQFIFNRCFVAVSRHSFLRLSFSEAFKSLSRLFF